MNNYSIRLSDTMMARLKEESALLEISTSDLIRALLSLAIQNHLDS